MKMPDIYETQDFLLNLDVVGVPRIMHHFGMNFKDAAKVMDFILSEGLAGEKVGGFNYKVIKEKLIYRVIKKSEVPEIVGNLNHEMVAVMKAIEINGADRIEIIKEMAGDNKAVDEAIDILIDLKIICKSGETYMSRVAKGISLCLEKVMIVKHRAQVLNRVTEKSCVRNMLETFLKYAKVDDDL
ncbi:MAG: hypothetical protein IKU84_03285 [Clostridia bacterium]|nr:hypothetical protein [Clostridia bacterium]